MLNKILSSGAVVVAGLVYAGHAYAGPPSVFGDNVSAKPDSFATNVTLTVTGPDGFSVSEFSQTGAPSVSISEKGKVADGLYTWTTTAMTRETMRNPKARLNNGRGELEKEFINKSVSESGVFRVTGGVIAQIEDQKEAPTKKKQEANFFGFGK